MNLPLRAKAMLAVLALAIAFSAGWISRGWKDGAQQLKATTAQAAADVRGAAVVVNRTQVAAKVTQDVGAKLEIRASAERVITREIIRKVPVYVTNQSDRSLAVPLGFVRLHDAAATGSAPAIPDGPGQSVDSPSGVALSTVAGVVADNYGTCRVWREQLIGWQSWYHEQGAAWDASDPALEQVDRPPGRAE